MTLDQRWNKKNFDTCWGDRAHWGPVNRHVWRRAAMYHGGDCSLAGFPGAKAHDRIWNEPHWRKA